MHLLLPLANQDIPRCCFSSMSVPLCESVSLLQHRYLLYHFEDQWTEPWKESDIMYQRPGVSGSGKSANKIPDSSAKNWITVRKIFPVEEDVKTYMEFMKFNNKKKKCKRCLVASNHSYFRSLLLHMVEWFYAILNWTEIDIDIFMYVSKVYSIYIYIVCFGVCGHLLICIFIS